MDPVWSLAFTLPTWRERRKAELWAVLQEGGHPALAEAEARELERLRAGLPRIRERAEALGARLLLAGDPEAERLLAPLPYPVALWVRGTLPPASAVAVVGSRDASPRGRARARAWAEVLTRAQVGVLSGLARGIDGAAHEGALEAGPTWAVLGSGLDRPYPPEHAGLLERLVAAGGGVLSPFPPGAGPKPWHFPRRNLLLAAWSRGVLVVEGTLRSGSLVTAKLALDLGKDLWACPGWPEDPRAEGPNALLREGAARAVTRPEELLEDLSALVRA